MILEHGRSQNEMDILKKFLGRRPSMDAYLRAFGIQASMK
jgi:Zn-dependent oligopeptidase